MTEAEQRAAEQLMADLEDAVQKGEDMPDAPDTTSTEVAA